MLGLNISYFFFYIGLKLHQHLTGKNATSKANSASTALASVMSSFTKLRNTPLYNVVGNNELRNFSSFDLSKMLQLYANPDAGQVHLALL